MGFFDSVSRRKCKGNAIRETMMKGITKKRKRFNVALLIEYPPPDSFNDKYRIAVNAPLMFRVKHRLYIYLSPVRESVFR
jgi:hypothetical protein